MSDVIKEFLVALNYKVEGERTITDSVNKVARTVTTLAAAMSAAYGSIALATSKAAQNLEKLYYMSQRTNASAQNIRAFAFAAGQLGTSAEAAADAVEGLSQKIKETGGERGGIAGLLRSLGVATSSGGKQRDTADMLVDVGKKLATLAPHVARAYANALGIDEKTLNALMSGKMAGMMAENADKARKMGFNVNEAAKDSVGLMNSLRGVGNTLQMLFEKVMGSLFKSLGGDIKKFDDMLIANAGKISDALVAICKWVLEVADQFVKWLTGDKMNNGLTDLGTALEGMTSHLKNWNVTLDGFLTRLDKALWIFRKIADVSGWLGEKTGANTAPNAFGWGSGADGKDNRSALERVLPKWMGGKDAPGGAKTGDAAKRGAGKGAALPPYSNDLKTAIAQSAKDLGINAEDLATMISFETGGTFDKWKKGPTTKWGQHRGLIQWGEPQRKKYGVTEKSTVGEQMQAVTRYLRDHGVKPGMNGENVYAAINAGNANKTNASDAAAGGTWGTVSDKWRYQMGAHRQKAIALMSQPDRPGTMRQIATAITDAIMPTAKAATANGAGATAAQPFGAQQPLGGAAAAARGATSNTFSPTNNINIYGGGPDMVPILGRTLERSNNDLFRNGVGAFN